MLIYMNLPVSQHNEAIIESVHDKPSSSGAQPVDEQTTQGVPAVSKDKKPDFKEVRKAQPVKVPEPGKTLVIPRDILKMYGTAK